MEFLEPTQESLVHRKEERDCPFLQKKEKGRVFWALKIHSLETFDLERKCKYILDQSLGCSATFIDLLTSMLNSMLWHFMGITQILWLYANDRTAFRSCSEVQGKVVHKTFLALWHLVWKGEEACTWSQHISDVNDTSDNKRQNTCKFYVRFLQWWRWTGWRTQGIPKVERKRGNQTKGWKRISENREREGKKASLCKHKYLLIIKRFFFKIFIF